MFAGPKMNPWDTSGYKQNPSRITNHGDWRESKSRRPFFRNLLDGISGMLCRAGINRAPTWPL